MILDDNHSVMRVGIQGSWDCSDFADFFTSISRLYRVQFQLVQKRDFENDYFYSPTLNWPAIRGEETISRHGVRYSGPLFHLENTEQQLSETFDYAIHTDQYKSQNLMTDIGVAGIKYGSPGFADFAGIGKVIEQIRKLFAFLIRHRDEYRLRAARDERYELENERIRIENARAFVSLAQEIGVGPEELVQLVAYVGDQQRVLAHLVGQFKISEVSDHSPEEYHHKFKNIPYAKGFQDRASSEPDDVRPTKPPSGPTSPSKFDENPRKGH